MIKRIKKIYHFLKFIEEQRLKSMEYSGRGWG